MKEIMKENRSENMTLIEDNEKITYLSNNRINRGMSLYWNAMSISGGNFFRHMWKKTHDI